jgi:hypothetical protein
MRTRKLEETMKRMCKLTLTLLATLLVLGTFSTPASAHCDRMDGPVVADARRALDSGKVAPVLKWITGKQEPEIRAALARALSARKDRRRRPAADRAFFATLVRLHRQSEGAPFTGLKPAGGPVHPAVAAADRALAGGDVEELRGRLAAALAKNVDARFYRVQDLAPGAETSPAKGRAYVKAYVRYVHFIKHLHQVLTGGKGHH